MKIFAALLFLLLLINTCSQEALSEEGQHRSITKKKNGPKEDLPNFHEVHPFLYRSGEPSKAGMEKLKEMGVKTVIDLRASSEMAFDEKTLARELGMNYIQMVMTSAPPTDKQVNTLLKTIEEAKANPEKGPVLVHCAHGSDRTGCMIGIWRVAEEGWTYEDAYKEMRKYWFTPKFTRLADAVKERVPGKNTGKSGN